MCLHKCEPSFTTLVLTYSEKKTLMPIVNIGYTSIFSKSVDHDKQVKVTKGVSIQVIMF